MSIANFDFSGKYALVTGAGKGIGRGITLGLHKAGCTVISVTRSQADLDSLVKETENDGKIIPVLLDLSVSQTETNSALRPFFQKYPIDYLVNNAAISNASYTLDKVTPEDLKKHFDINLNSLIWVTQIYGQELRNRYANDNSIRGSVVNISSQASQTILDNHGIYGMTKASVDYLTRQQAKELGRESKIRVNAVNPTVIWTDMARLHWSKPENANPALARIPLGRFGEIDEVVQPVLFLLSDAAGMITGERILIDGGFVTTN